MRRTFRGSLFTDIYRYSLNIYNKVCAFNSVEIKTVNIDRLFVISLLLLSYYYLGSSRSIDLRSLIAKDNQPFASI